MRSSSYLLLTRSRALEEEILNNRNNMNLHIMTLSKPPASFSMCTYSSINFVLNFIIFLLLLISYEASLVSLSVHVCLIQRTHTKFN